MILHGYFRSGASWRVRIALGLKGIAAAQRFHHLRRGEQRASDYLALNPQGLVPSLVLDDGRTLTQSLAIIEYLDETVPEPPLLPIDPIDRARVRGFAQIIACDVHPIQNLKILERVRALGHDDATTNEWARTTIAEGLASCEALLAKETGPFCFGARPTLADVCLIPQLANARRFGVEMNWPRIHAVAAACAELPAFAGAVPDQQGDAE